MFDKLQHDRHRAAKHSRMFPIASDLEGDSSKHARLVMHSALPQWQLGRFAPSPFNSSPPHILHLWTWTVHPSLVNAPPSIPGGRSGIRVGSHGDAGLCGPVRVSRRHHRLPRDLPPGDGVRPGSARGQRPVTAAGRPGRYRPCGVCGQQRAGALSRRLVPVRPAGPRR